VLAFLILSERPLPLQLVGGAVIVIGVRLAARRSPIAAGERLVEEARA
jgi:drug/metabolite transporter (DMT)-like permease